MWRHGTIPIVGLTGGVASGKSAVAALLGENGFATIDADKVGHAVLEDPDVRQKLVERFGNGVMFEHDQLTTEPKVDRRAGGDRLRRSRGPACAGSDRSSHHRAQFARRSIASWKRPAAGSSWMRPSCYEAGWDDLMRPRRFR